MWAGDWVCRRGVTPEEGGGQDRGGEVRGLEHESQVGGERGERFRDFGVPEGLWVAMRGGQEAGGERCTGVEGVNSGETPINCSQEEFVKIGGD